MQPVVLFPWQALANVARMSNAKCPPLFSDGAAAADDDDSTERRDPSDETRATRPERRDPSDSHQRDALAFAWRVPGVWGANLYGHMCRAFTLRVSRVRFRSEPTAHRFLLPLSAVNASHWQAISVSVRVLQGVARRCSPLLFLLALTACGRDPGVVEPSEPTGWSLGEPGSPIPDDWCEHMICLGPLPDRDEARRCLRRSYCMDNALGSCTLPGICIPPDRCVTDAGCEEERTCYGGRCLTAAEVDAVPAPSAWGYVVAPHMAPWDGAFSWDGALSCFSEGSTRQLSEYIGLDWWPERDDVDTSDWRPNLGEEPAADFVENDEWTVLFGVIPLDDGTYLFQVFEGTNDLDGDGNPDQPFSVRAAGDGVFRITPEAYARGHARALRVESLGTSILAEHATNLPWRMPVLPWARMRDGLLDYTLQNASLQGDLYLSDAGLWTGTSTRETEDGVFRHGNLVIGGSIHYVDIAGGMRLMTQGCACDGLAPEDSYICEGDCYRLFDGGVCIEGIARRRDICEDRPDRPYWCDSGFMCGDDRGPASLSGPPDADVDTDFDSHADSYSACFMPEVVPAQVRVGAE